MFVLDQNDSYLWPVSIDLPADRAKKTFTFDGEFRRLDEGYVTELQDKYFKMLVAMRQRVSVLEGYGVNDASIFDEPLEITYEQIADEVLCGWAKVVDSKGKDIEFSEASKAQMYRVQGAPAAIVQAWMESVGKPSERSAAKAGGFRAKN